MTISNRAISKSSKKSKSKKNKASASKLNDAPGIDVPKVEQTVSQTQNQILATDQELIQDQLVFQPSFKNHKKLIICLLLVVASIFSHFYFVLNSPNSVLGLNTKSSTYENKSSNQITKPNEVSVNYFKEEVSKKNTKFITPNPATSAQISVSDNENSKSKILESTQSIKELQDFYKNFFYVNNWILIRESFEDNLAELEFKNQNFLIKITLNSQFNEQTVDETNLLPKSQSTLINVQEFTNYLVPTIKTDPQGL